VMRRRPSGVKASAVGVGTAATSESVKPLGRVADADEDRTSTAVAQAMTERTR